MDIWGGVCMDEREFDRFADEYYQQHKSNIRITGESPEYFARYKIVDLKSEAVSAGLEQGAIIDFGCGIGNSIPYFRKEFPDCTLACADVSRKSMSLAAARYPGDETYLEIENEKIPSADQSFALAFSACVFHHIDHDEHIHWLRELNRVTAPNGLLLIYEHNPFNPLTRHAVNTCPFDINARLLRPSSLKMRIEAAGWRDAAVKYRVFIPSGLAHVRWLEEYLKWLPLGAQYYVVARK